MASPAVDSFLNRLERRARRGVLQQSAAATAAGLGAAIAAALLSLVLETLFWLPSWGRAVLVAFTISCGVAVFLRFGGTALIGWLLATPHQRLRDALERRASHADSDALRSLVDLAFGRDTGSPAPLKLRAIDELRGRIPAEEIDRLGVSPDMPRGAAVFSGAALLFLSALFALPADLHSAAERLLHPLTAYERPLPFAVHLDAPSSPHLAGTPFTIRGTVTGSGLPGEVTFRLRRDGERHVEEEAVGLASDSTFAYSLRPNDSFSYRVVAGRYSSPWSEVPVTHRPFLRDVAVSIEPPAYTDEAARRLSAGEGRLEALPGSRILLEADVSANTEHVLLESDGVTDTLRRDEGRALAELRMTEAPRSFFFQLVSTDGLPSADPVTYRISPREDLGPSIVLTAPETDLPVPGSGTVDIAASARDDHGISRARLFFRPPGSDDAESGYRSLPLPIRRGTRVDIAHAWNIAEHLADALAPGDRMTFYVQVWDNNTVTGPSTAQSAVRSLYVPASSDPFDEVNSLRDSTSAELERMRERARALEDDYSDSERSLRERRAAWQDRQALDRLEQEAERLQQQRDAVQRQLEKTARTLEQEKMADPETMEQLRELQRAAEEIDSDELRRALEQLQRAGEQSPQQMQRAMDQARQASETLQERIERVRRLFERMRTQQELKETAERLERLAERQEEAARSTDELRQPDSTASETPERDALARSQEEAAREMEKITSRLDSLSQQSEGLSSKEKQQVQKQMQEMQRQELPRRMRQNADAVRREQDQQAQEQQQQMQQELQQMSSSLQQMQQSMNGKNKSINTAKIRQALYDVLLLSDQQELLGRNVAEVRASTADLATPAREQHGYRENLAAVADTLTRLAREVPQMRVAIQKETGRALTAMQRAESQLLEGELREAGAQQRSSLMHLNELALLLSDVLNQMQPSSGSGQGAQQMMQQMQQMSQQQNQISREIQQMLNETRGQRLSLDQQRRLQQLARQQAKMRRELQRISRSSRVRDSALDAVERVADDLRRSIDQLREGRLDQQIDRQQRQIRTRMLQARDALRRQELDERRQGTEARPASASDPGEISREKAREEIREALIRAIESGYTSDYERLIRRYFELLDEQ